MTAPARPESVCRCGRTVPRPGEVCTGCWARTVAGVVTEALTIARSGRAVRITVQTPQGTRVFARRERHGRGG